eukprot:960494-Amphidinium_carterae.4
MGCQASLKIHSGSSAARGYASKAGIGKGMKHMPSSTRQTSEPNITHSIDYKKHWLCYLLS